MSGMYHTSVSSSTSSLEKDYWRTPENLTSDIKNLLNINQFSIDVCCANDEIAIADSLHCLTEFDDSLAIDNWIEFLGLKTIDVKDPFFCNPPFSKKYLFFQKAVEQVKLTRIPCAFVMPYEPVSQLWREKVSPQDCLVYVPDGRYHYLRPDGSKNKHGCNFPTCFIYILPFSTHGAVTIDYVKSSGAKMFTKGQKVMVNNGVYIIATKSSYKVNRKSGQLEQHYIVKADKSDLSIVVGESEIRKYKCR